MRRQALWFGEARASGEPSYWEVSSIATDAGTEVALSGQTAMLYPAGRGGESVFRMAFLSIQHVASAVLRVTPVVEATVGTLAPGTGTVTPVPGIITLPQQTSEPRTAVYPVPLVAVYARSGAPLGKVNVRGVGLALLIETVGAVGNGMLTIDAVEIEHEPVRKTQYEAVTT